MYRSLLPMPTTCLLTDGQDYQAKGDHLPFSSFPTALHQQGEDLKKKKNHHQKHLKNARRGEGREGGLWCKTDKALTVNTVAD